MVKSLAGASKDYLTGCYQKDDLKLFLSQMMDESVAFKKPFSIMVMDVDHFKNFNDKYGHLFGDSILKYFASSLRLNLDEYENFPFRFGGDEFVMIFPGKSDAEVLPLAHRLKKNIKIRPFLFKACPIKISFSGGIASYPTDGPTWEEVLENADRAMYFSKQNGRGRIVLFKKMKSQRWLWALFFLIVGATSLILLLKFYEPRELFQGANKKMMPSVAEFIKKSKNEVLGRWKSFRERGTTAGSPNSAASNTTTQKEAAPTAPQAAAASFPDKIYLTSGRLIHGQVVQENASGVTIQLNLSSGTGTVRYPASLIKKIERGS